MPPLAMHNAPPAGRLTAVRMGARPPGGGGPAVERAIAIIVQPTSASAAAGVRRDSGFLDNVQIALRKRNFDFRLLKGLVHRAIQLVCHAAAIDWPIDPAQ